MGYCEIHCVICGTSFRIGRLRTHDEPPSHAWNYYGSDFCVGDDSGARHELISGSCDENDSDSCNGNKKCRNEPSCTFDDTGEHIAGPACWDEHGYNGHHISAETARRARFAQCIIRKPNFEDQLYRMHREYPPAWTPAPDDEPWEKTSGFFLSGMTDSVEENIGISSEGWLPVRHGVSNFEPNSLYTDGRPMGIPFHPWCLEVYQRAAFARTGTLDVDGLGEWIERNHGACYDHPRSVETRHSHDQWWMHDYEFLMADPLKDDKFAEMLQEAVDLSDDFNPTNSAFPDRVPRTTTTTSKSDPFLALPPELCQQILTHLPTPSVAALRLTSSAFTHLPISFFHHLLRQDFPWIWEADPATTSALPIYSQWNQKVFDRATQYLHGRADKNNTADQASAAGQEHSADKESAAKTTSGDYRTPLVLPRHQTNWFRLYVSIKNNSKPKNKKKKDPYISERKGPKVPGLWNRERIWRDCEEYLRRIGGGAFEPGRGGYTEE